MKARLTLILLAATLALSAATAGCGSKGGEAAMKNGSRSEEATSRVRVATPATTTLHRRLEYTGTVEPVRQVRMVPEITAKIVKLEVANGDRIKKGQLIAKFDTKLFALQQKQASATVKLADTQVSSVEKDLARLEPLAASGAVSEQQLDQMKSGLDAAKAQSEQAKAALGLASYSVQKSTLKAPFDGIVTNLLVNEGEFVGPQMAAYGMLTLVDISEVKVKVSVTEKDLPLVKLDQGAEMTSEAWPGQVFAGKVSVITPSADPISKSFPIEIKAPNPEESLKAGMFIRVSIHVASVEGALSVPPAAVVEMKDSPVVFVVDEESRARMRPVKIGIETQEGVQILEGDVGPGDRVIVEGNFGLKDGAKVIVAE